ncbi:MAG: MogA/MoaB family molybdenum cofactor biosynthesis protein [Desulfobulbaceae bacterium]|uniref:Molybdenum cofactor biosynthesis protein B n=1 Tax=Candidatus Desulfobia pelagia TaxID=2841692 RepID=A0A8J6NC18_9BACT|nr:MogA/MoaB family molybdenum cofactor biosynthesis protein [Candidatus Desulfobia pelagia]
MDKNGYTCAILTISDKGSRGERDDTSGPQLNRQLTESGFTVTALEIVPDSQDAIATMFRKWADQDNIDLIVSTGGTGVSPSDVTPEATLPILHREIPGIGEAMRMASFTRTTHAILSRGVAGIRRESLIINLPGSERAARENLEVILPSLQHALYKIKGGMKDCADCTKNNSKQKDS